MLDESLELAVQIGRLASLRGWQPHFVGLLHELEVAVGAHGRPALIVVNRQPPLTAWELGQWLRGLEWDLANNGGTTAQIEGAIRGALSGDPCLSG